MPALRLHVEEDILQYNSQFIPQLLYLAGINNFKEPIKILLTI
jgi:hypothetical protein